VHYVYVFILICRIKFDKAKPFVVNPLQSVDEESPPTPPLSDDEDLQVPVIFNPNSPVSTEFGSNYRAHLPELPPPPAGSVGPVKILALKTGPSVSNSDPPMPPPQQPSPQYTDLPMPPPQQPSPQHQAPSSASLLLTARALVDSASDPPMPPPMQPAPLLSPDEEPPMPPPLFFM
jgi:hypothetical protein